MKPCARCPVFVLAGLASAALVMTGCDRGSDGDGGVATEQAPKPKATATERSSRKAFNAYNSVSGYLKEQDPELRDRMQKAAEHFVRDKDKWCARLKAREHELQPRIAKVREQISKADAKSGEALKNLRQELAALETQRADVERKLGEIESVTSDTWKAMRDELGMEDDHSSASPTPKERDPL